MKRVRILFILCSFLATACTLAPITTHTTARSVGKGQAEVSAGFVVEGFYTFDIHYGIFEDLDVSVHYDFLSYSMNFKYSIANYADGLSYGVFAGYGGGSNSKYTFVGPIVSYKLALWEPYIGTRYNFTEVNNISEFETDITRELKVRFGDYDFQYLQSFLGTRFWLGQTFFVGGEFQIYYSFNKTRVDFTDHLLISAYTGVNF